MIKLAVITKTQAVLKNINNFTLPDISINQA